MATEEDITHQTRLFLITDKPKNISTLNTLLEQSGDPCCLLKRLESATGVNVIAQISQGKIECSEASLTVFLNQLGMIVNPNERAQDKQTLLDFLAKNNYHKLLGSLGHHELSLAAPTSTSSSSTGSSSTENNTMKTTADMTREFVKRIILVHPLQANSLLYYLFGNNKEALVAYTSTGDIDTMGSAVNAVVHDDAMLTDDAGIGRHLDFENRADDSGFIDRPHIHWWMNGLFQANSGGDWEDAIIAYLEPLAQFDHVMGSAPYDVMTMGPHRLSKQSCIIVPENATKALEKRLHDFHGKIIGYDPDKISLREAINEVLASHYPEAYHFLNKHGDDVNAVGMSSGGQDFDTSRCRKYDYDSNLGYFRELFIKQGPGSTPIAFMRGRDEVLFEPFKAYVKGRYIGLHQGAPTDVERDPQFKLLAKVSAHPQTQIGHNKQAFIGFDSARPATLLSISCYRKYIELKSFSPETGMHDYAYYFIRKAIIADLQSLHLARQGEVLPADQVKARLSKPAVAGIIHRLKLLSESPNDTNLKQYQDFINQVYLRKLDVGASKALSEEMHNNPQTDQNITKTEESGSSPWCSFWTVGAAVVAVGAVALAGKAVYDSYTSNSP